MSQRESHAEEETEEEKQVMGEELEEEEEDFGEDGEQVDEEVYVGVPTKATQPIDDFWARVGGNMINDVSLLACPKCKQPDACRETICVSAPFADLSSRFIALIICKACRTWFVRRQQTTAVADDESAQQRNTDQDEGGTNRSEVSQKPAFEQTIWGEVSTGGEDVEAPNANSQQGPSDAELEALFERTKVADDSKTSATVSVSKKKTKSKKKKQNAGKGTLIDFISEPEEVADGLVHEKELLSKYQQNAHEWGEPTVDPNLLKTFNHSARKHKQTHRDFSDFFERIALAPKQRIRYSFMGRPLWPSEAFKPKSNSVAPDCESCGAPRGFEFQITPQAVEDFQNLTGMEVEFSSILVFTCEDSCDGSSSEYCVICPAI